MKTLLMVRKQQEDVAQKEVVLARQQLQKVINIVEQLQVECDTLEQDLNKQQRAKHSIVDYRNHFLYLQNTRKKIALYQDEIFKKQNIVEARRQDAIKAMKKKKVIENIKEKQFTSWKEDYQKMETKLLDELATIRHIRDNTQSGK